MLKKLKYMHSEFDNMKGFARVIKNSVYLEENSAKRLLVGYYPTKLQRQSIIIISVVIVDIHGIILFKEHGQSPIVQPHHH